MKVALNLNNLGYCYLMLGNREVTYLQKLFNIRIKLGHKYALTSVNITLNITKIEIAS
jgi:hypothetical protein